MYFSRCHCMYVYYVQDMEYTLTAQSGYGAQRCSSVGERRSLTGELPLVCA